MLGILFLISSAKGHSVCFSYPYPPQSKIWGFNQDFMASLLSPKTALCDQPLVLSIDGNNFIGRAATFQSPLYFSKLCQPESSLSMFNIVLVTRKIKPFYSELLARIASILVYEQVKRNFVKSQVDIISGVRDQNSSDLNQKILQVSSLARALANIYHTLSNPNDPLVSHKFGALAVDNIFDPCILLQNIYPPNVLQDIKTKIRPYQTILLLADKQDILRMLPLGSSPLLIELLEKADPLKCFEEYELLLNCSLSQIYKLAAHLVFWKKARIIDAVSIRNVYTISPKADLSLISGLQTQFNLKFSANLLNLLEILSVPRPLSSLLPSKADKNVYLDMIVFLQRHGFISQVHMFFYLKLSTEPNAEEFPAVSEAFIEIVNPDVYLIATPESPTEREKNLLIQQKRRSSSIEALFNRILPFLNGKYHVDEILSRENITRKELKAVVGYFEVYSNYSQYRDEIVTALYFSEESDKE